jgi:hypothetical protein
MVPHLRDLLGKLVVMKIPALNENDHVFVKLLRLEPAGVWLESHLFNTQMLEKFDMPLSSTTLIQFVPFAAIDYIISSVETVALSEKAFGLDE